MLFVSQIILLVGLNHTFLIDCLKVRTIYLYSLHERTKNSNLEQSTGKLFLPLPRFSKRLEDSEERPVNEPTKFYTTETLLAHIATFPSKNRNVNFCRMLKEMKGKEVLLVASGAPRRALSCVGCS